MIWAQNLTTNNNSYFIFFRSSVVPRGYFNQMATLRPSPASTGGQLSDPDSGFFSSSNETWLGSDPQSATSTAMLIDSASSPLSSSSSMLSHPQQNNISQNNQIIPNNKLLAHTLENRKRVLHSLMREKTDTLVWFLLVEMKISGKIMRHGIFTIVIQFVNVVASTE